MTEEYVPLSISEEQYFGGYAPVQGEGVLSDGRYYYFRVRHQHASLWVGEIPFGSDVDYEGRTIYVYLSGVDSDPHVWSYLPSREEGNLSRHVLDLLVWTFSQMEYWEKHGDKEEGK